MQIVLCMLLRAHLTKISEKKHTKTFKQPVSSDGFGLNYCQSFTYNTE